MWSQLIFWYALGRSECLFSFIFHTQILHMMLWFFDQRLTVLMSTPRTPGIVIISQLLVLGLILILRYHHLAQWTLLHHQAHDLIKSVCRGHCSMLRVCIISWSNLDNICCDQIDTLKASDNGSQFTCRPTAGLRGACCRCDCLFVSCVCEWPFCLTYTRDQECRCLATSILAW